MAVLRPFVSVLLTGVLLLAVPAVLPQDPEQALLVFYRPKRFTGSGLTPSVYLNGEQIARLDNGRYFSLRVPPGRHEITSSMKHAPLAIEVKAREAAFLEMVILSGNWRGGGRMIPSPAEDALAVIQKLKPLDKKWIMDARIGFELELAAQTLQPEQPAP
jgi:hypothetical protein